MAYQINKYDNELKTVVADGTVDSSTSLKFVGKNFAGYGEIQNENFMWLLENFARAEAPALPVVGQVWYNSSEKKLKFYDGASWKSAGGSELNTVQPSGLAAGDLWWDVANKQLSVYDGTSYVLVGPQSAGSGVTQMLSKEIYDNTSTLKSIIAATIDNKTVFTASPVQFTANTPIADLPSFNNSVVRQGITLPDTGDSGVTTGTYRFWGTATNSEKLSGFAASDFVSKAEFSNANFTNDTGITIGETNDIRIYVDNTTGGATQGVIENGTSSNSEIIFQTTNSSQTLVHSVTINTLGLIPARTNVFDIGQTDRVWKDVYATNFVGEASRAATLRVGTDFRSASVSATENTVAVRDATGNITANLFQGIATQARYADLAEKYTTDQEHAVGTVLMVCGHADHEMEACQLGAMVAGVISENPAYLMNAEAAGQAVALVGRVPVRIIGSVKKGQAVYAWNNGTASTVETSSLVGVALESNSATEEKLVECILKV